jgi:hypothetical protein
MGKARRTLAEAYSESSFSVLMVVASVLIALGAPRLLRPGEHRGLPDAEAELRRFLHVALDTDIFNPAA